MMTIFMDRAEAGRYLASKLKRFTCEDTVVYALPRGGVSVGKEIAEALGIPMDVTFASKMCAPWESVTQPATDKNDRTAERRKVRPLASSRPILPAGRVAIVVDDGLASCVKLQTVIKALRWHGAKTVIVAQPVASRAAIREFEKLVDDVICVDVADDAERIGDSYLNLPRVSEGEVEDVVGRLTSH